MYKCHSLHIPHSRTIGRIAVFFHLIKYHREGNGFLFFLNMCKFLFTGYARELGWYYKQFMLFKVINDKQINTILEIFKENIYDLPLKRIKPVIVDIGAFIGDSVIFFYNKYPGAKIYVFEPNKINYSILQLNLKHNNLNMKRVHLSNKAVVGNRAHTFKYIHYSKVLLSNASLFKQHLAIKDNVVKDRISTISFKSLLSEIPQIDLLKIDAEGMEHEILPLIAKNTKAINSFIIEVHYSSETLNKLNQAYALFNKLSKNYKLIIHKTSTQTHILGNNNWRLFYTKSNNVYDSFILYGMKREKEVKN